MGEHAKELEDQSTRDKLMATAERLYAIEGIAAVSLRRINRDAGQANASALHYHFGSREELISSILERRMATVNERRMRFLDELEAEGRSGDLRALCEAMVVPLSEQVRLADDHSYYLGFVAAVYTSSEVNIYELSRENEGRSLRRLARLFVDVLEELPNWAVKLRFSLTVRSVIYALADWERDRHIGKLRPGMTFDEFVSFLVDMTHGTMIAEHSITER